MSERKIKFVNEALYANCPRAALVDEENRKTSLAAGDEGQGPRANHRSQN